MKNTYLNVLQLVGNNEIEEGETLRLNHTNCPAGVDTKRRLYLTKKDGVIVGYCHNCSSKGVATKSKNVYDIITELTNVADNKENKKTFSAALADVIYEDTFLFWRNLCEQDMLNLDASLLEWLLKSKLMEAPKRSILYSAVSVKLLHGGKLSSLRLVLKDKYLNPYGYLHTQFLRGGKKRQLLNVDSVKKGHYITKHIDGSTLIMSEDIFSAAVIAEALKGNGKLYTIVALLGTSIPLSLQWELQNYSKVILALDGDEAGVRAALKIAIQLRCLGIDTKILSTRGSVDPKCMSMQDLKNTVQNLER